MTWLAAIALLQANPEFKGIKTCLTLLVLPAVQLQANPEFKGIKTEGTKDSLFGSALLQANPEFKGIKTKSSMVYSALPVGFKPTLNSKGLRLVQTDDVFGGDGFKPTLNSKGLRPVASSPAATMVAASSQP